MLRPAHAHAQLGAFVQAVRELAEANGRAEPARSNDVHAAAERMAVALAQWDRDIAALEARVAREIVAGASMPRASQLHIELAVAYHARRRITDALRELDAAAALRPSSSDLQVLRALAFESDGRSDDASRAFSAAWRLGSDDPVKAYYLIARSQSADAGQRQHALAALRAGYQRMRTATTGPSTAPFVMLDAIADNLSRTPVVGDDAIAPGFALIVAGKFGDAAEVLRGARLPGKIGGDSPVAQFARAQQDEARNRVSEARHEYQAALRGALTGRSTILVAIARLAQVEDALPQAIDAFREAVRISPNDPNLHKELASAYTADGRTDDAFCELIAAVLIDPLDAQAHAAIGQLYIDTGQYTDAVAALNRGLELRPAAYQIRYALATALIRSGKASEGAHQMELFEQARRGADEQRRRGIADEVERAERPRGR